MQLIGRYLSPFTRRVAVTIGLYGLDFEHLPLQHTGDEAARLRQINPLGRVPALVLDDGKVVVESGVILDYLDRLVGPEKSLTPAGGDARTEVMTYTAIATGAVDKAVATAYEIRFRPEEKRHAPWVERCTEQAHGGYRHLNAALTGDWLVGDSMTQADVTTAVCWQFAKVATPGLAAAMGDDGANLDALVERMMQHEAYSSTVPPV